MEQRFEQQIAELKNFIISRNHSRRGRSRRRRPRKQNSDGKGSAVEGELSRSPTWSSSRDSSRDFGGRKLKIPIFRGDDAYGWIVRAERYFKLNMVDDEDKLDAVVIALDDKALNWY